MPEAFSTEQYNPWSPGYQLGQGGYEVPQVQYADTGFDYNPMEDYGLIGHGLTAIGLGFIPAADRGLGKILDKVKEQPWVGPYIKASLQGPGAVMKLLDLATSTQSAFYGALGSSDLAARTLAPGLGLAGLPLLAAGAYPKPVTPQEGIEAIKAVPGGILKGMEENYTFPDVIKNLPQEGKGQSPLYDYDENGQIVEPDVSKTMFKMDYYTNEDYASLERLKNTLTILPKAITWGLAEATTFATPDLTDFMVPGAFDVIARFAKEVKAGKTLVEGPTTVGTALTKLSRNFNKYAFATPEERIVIDIMSKNHNVGVVDEAVYEAMEAKSVHEQAILAKQFGEEKVRQGIMAVRQTRMPSLTPNIKLGLLQHDPEDFVGELLPQIGASRAETLVDSTKIAQEALMAEGFVVKQDILRYMTDYKYEIPGSAIPPDKEILLRPFGPPSPVVDLLEEGTTAPSMGRIGKAVPQQLPFETVEGKIGDFTFGEWDRGVVEKWYQKEGSSYVSPEPMVGMRVGRASQVENLAQEVVDPEKGLTYILERDLRGTTQATDFVVHTATVNPAKPYTINLDPTARLQEYKRNLPTLLREMVDETNIQQALRTQNLRNYAIMDDIFGGTKNHLSVRHDIGGGLAASGRIARGESPIKGSKFDRLARATLPPSRAEELFEQGTKMWDIDNPDSWEAVADLYEDALAVPLLKKQGHDFIIEYSRREKAVKKVIALDPIRAFTREVKEHIYRPLIADEIVQLGLKYKDLDTIRKYKSLKMGYVEPELMDEWYENVLYRRTPEFEEHLARKMSDLGSEFGPRHAKRFTESFHPEGLNIDLINQITSRSSKEIAPGMRPEDVSEFFEGFTGKAFIDDPSVLNLITEQRSILGRAQTQSYLDAANRLGKHVDEAPEWYVPLAISESKDPRMQIVRDLVKDLKFPPEVAAHLNNIGTLDRIPQATNALLKWIDNAYTATIANWKVLALNTPSYYIKNFGGAMLNMFSSGMYDVSKIKTAYSILRRELRPEDLIQLGGKEYTVKQLNRMRRDFGLSGGFATIETRGFYEENPLLVYKVPGVGKAYRKGHAFNTAIEDTLRFGQFLGHMDQGMEPWEAMLKVKEAQFDYLTGLTDFERIIRKYGIPFYTFTRFNLPFQAKAFVKNPHPYIRIGSLINRMRSDEATNEMNAHEALTPDFLNNMGIPTRVNADGKVEIKVIGGWAPIADLEILMSKPNFRQAVGRLNPILQKVSEQAFNKEIFWDRAIEEDESKHGKFLNMTMRKRVIHLLKAITPLTVADRILKSYYDNDGKLTTDDRKQVEAWMRTFFGVPTYQVDISGLMEKRRYDIERIQRSIKSARKKGDWDRVDALESYLEDLKRGY